MVIVLLRLLFQIVRADFSNPLSQFIIKATNPVLIPVRRYLPGLWGIDLSSLLLAYVLQIIETGLLAIFQGTSIPLFVLLWVSIGQLLAMILYIYLFAIIIQAIVSWINPGQYNQMTILIHQLTEPLMAPVRRKIPPVSGLDFSPLIVIIVINLLIMMIPYLF